MIEVEREETLDVQTSEDIVLLRQSVRRVSIEMGFSLIDQTKIVTAASELGRNTVDHGGGGVVHVATVTNGTRRGLRLMFEDSGKGIANLDLALTDGYTTGSGLGLGLSGSRRLMNEFSIQSKPGEGTTVTVTKWK